MATADDLILDVRQRLSDVSDEAYGDALLIQFQNEGIKHFCITTGCLQYVDNITSGATISALSLRNELTYDFINIYGVAYASTALDFAPRYEAVKWNPASGTPTGWSVWGRILYFDTIITLSTTNDIDIWYTYIPAAMTAISSTFPLDAKYEPAIAAYVAYRVRDMLRDATLAERAYNEYQSVQIATAQINEALLMRGGYS